MVLSSEAFLSIYRVADAVFADFEANRNANVFFLQPAVRKSLISLDTRHIRSAFRINADDYGCRSHQTDWQDSSSGALRGKRLYYVPFSVLVESSGTSGYAFAIAFMYLVLFAFVSRPPTLVAPDSCYLFIYLYLSEQHQQRPETDVAPLW